MSLALCGLLIGCSTTNWRPIAYSLDECVRRAKLAMRDSDFTELLHIVDNAGGKAVSGRHGSYWGKIGCSSERRSIKVTVTGPDPALTETYKRSITKRF